MNTGSVIDKLTVYYTNADNLLNKRNELQLIITSNNIQKCVPLRAVNTFVRK